MSVEHSLDNRERLERVGPTNGFFARMGKVMGTSLRYRAMRWLGRIPGLGHLRRAADRPRIQPLHSAAGEMARWFSADFGTADKPLSLNDIPWDYVRDNQEEVPFLGLREYWYPALRSDELPHNEPQAVTLLGDNLVLFRDGQGKPSALENRCPHRGTLLTLGQVNVWDLGTITCRYHGMTFNGEGECVAFLADGPNSRACGKVRAKAYRTTEHAGIVWVYMGVQEPKPLLDSLPHARGVLADGVRIRERKDVPYNYLNILDNTVDMTHVGCLHRTCYLFGDQKLGGGVAYQELEEGGVHASLKDQGGHAGERAIDEITWYLPNLVYHGEEMMDGNLNGLWFWFVPRDIGSFTGWLIGSVNDKKAGPLKARSLATTLKKALQSDILPSMACFYGGDAPIQMAQGRIVRWDQENLMGTDRAVIKVRQMMKDAHKAEIQERRRRGLDALANRIDGGPGGGRLAGSAVATEETA